MGGTKIVSPPPPPKKRGGTGGGGGGGSTPRLDTEKRVRRRQFCHCKCQLLKVRVSASQKKVTRTHDQNPRERTHAAREENRGDGKGVGGKRGGGALVGESGGHVGTSSIDRTAFASSLIYALSWKMGSFEVPGQRHRAPFSVTRRRLTKNY